MTLAERIYAEAQRLPEPLAREVLDFIGFIEARHGIPAPGAVPAGEAVAAVFARYQADLTGYRFDREEANAR